MLVVSLVDFGQVSNPVRNSKAWKRPLKVDSSNI